MQHVIYFSPHRHQNHELREPASIPCRPINRSVKLCDYLFPVVPERFVFTRLQTFMKRRRDANELLFFICVTVF